MFRLKINIYSDGDFSCDFGREDIIDGKFTFYFNDNKKATETFLEIYKNMCKTIETEKEYLQDTVDFIKASKEYVREMANHFNTFEFFFELGNQEIECSLIELTKEDFEDGFKIEELPVKFSSFRDGNYLLYKIREKLSLNA